MNDYSFSQMCSYLKRGNSSCYYEHYRTYIWGFAHGSAKRLQHCDIHQKQKHRMIIFERAGVRSIYRQTE